jgi:hypothetical protein
MSNESFTWKGILRDWSHFLASPAEGTVEERATNDALIASLNEEFQHYALFDRYYEVILSTIIEGFSDSDRQIIEQYRDNSADGNQITKLAKKIERKAKALFQDLRKIIFPEAPAFVIIRRRFIPPVSSTNANAVAGGGASESRICSQLTEDDISVNSYDANRVEEMDASLRELALQDASCTDDVATPLPDFQEVSLNTYPSFYKTLDELDGIGEWREDGTHFSSADISSPQICVWCQKTDAESVTAGNTMIGVNCGCSACMCRLCWEEYFKRNYKRPDLAFIECPVCKQNVFPYLQQMFPDVKYHDDLPADVRAAWEAEARGMLIDNSERQEGGGRACGLCKRVTNPTHTRRSCPFRPLRRAFLENHIQTLNELMEEERRVLMRIGDRVQQAREELEDAEEEFEWKGQEVSDLDNDIQRLQDELLQYL